MVLSWESLHASGVTTTLNMNQIVNNDDLNDDDDDDVMDMLRNIFGVPSHNNNVNSDEDERVEANLGQCTVESDNAHNDPNMEKLNSLVKDADKELYLGCKKYNRLSFLLHLYNVKCHFGWSNKSFDVLLKLLKDAFPKGETLPSSMTEARKIVDGIGLKYEKIDASPNDCMLFWKKNASATECTVCHTSRWKEHGEKEDGAGKRRNKAIPAKMLQYFPLNPRLQRLFTSDKMAKDMVRHEKERKKDGILRHPADLQAWRHVDALYPPFGAEPRNVRLGLTSDGFNPFGRQDSRYSVWPVILIPYNLHS